MFEKLKHLSKYDKKSYIKNNLKLEKLTPAKCENMDFYKDTLDFIFNEDDLLNIGITASYSAGKSSVIKTYEALNPDKRFIYISLAYFKELEGVENEEDTKSINETELEGKIINQLIHQIDSNKISQTRFKVKTKISTYKIMINTTFMSIFVIMQVYLYKFKEWNITVSGIDYYKGNSSIEKMGNSIINFLKFTTSSKFVFISILISITIFISYLLKIVKSQMEKPIFKKIKFQNNEIELFDKDEESYFDKYLDEIIYIFKNSHVDAIIFEDIDRYGDNLIFSKLREVNYLINKKVHKKFRCKFKFLNKIFKQKSTRFFYLVRDDMFISKDRTKFFDFIMPIVPVIDSSNSYDQILKHFKYGGILDDFDNNFLERLSLYIDDMRLLKNIYNEYIIYHGRIQCIELDCNKLLAIIVYKNIFPKDFNDLQLNSGFVYQVFKNKDLIVEKLKRNIDEEIQNNLKIIQEIENEQLNDVDELNTLYIVFGLNNYKVQGKLDNDFDSRVQYIKELKNNSKYVDVYSGWSNSFSSGANVEYLFDKLKEIQSYNERKSIIEEKMLNGTNRLKKLNIDLELKKNTLSSLKLAEFINKDNIEEVFTLNCFDVENKIIKFEEILNNQYYPLIKYLIRNRYIDETYFDYLTYFYENSLTKTDKIFLRSITDEIPKDYNYKLVNVTQIISRLKPIDFEKEEILNFNLLNVLLEQKHEYLNAFLKFLRVNKHFKFIYAYIEETSNLESFMKELNKSWKTIWLDLLENKEISEDQKKAYMINTLYYSSIDDIKAMNENKIITDYINYQDEFINIIEPKTEVIIEKFIGLNIKFKYINYEKANKDLFKKIYKNNLYELNFSMIELILKNIYNYPNVEGFKLKNYTLISSKPTEPLKYSVDKNINFYMKNIINKIDGKFYDKQTKVISILRNSNIEHEVKREYVSKLYTHISDLRTLNKNLEIWDDLFKLNLVKYSINNILFYYFNKPRIVPVSFQTYELDSILVDYLNINKANDLDIRSKFKQYDISKFFNSVIITEDLNIETYEKLLTNYEDPISEFNYENISEDKVLVLIKLNIISLTKFNVKFVREHYQGVCKKFFCSDINGYISCLDDELTNDYEILSLLDEPSISDELKFKLVEKVTNAISLIDRNYTEPLIMFIMKNKFNTDDLLYIVNNYEKYSSVLRKVIQELCTLYIEEIYENSYNLHYDLLHTLMSNNQIDIRYRLSILYDHLDSLNFSEIKECLSSEDLSEFLAILEGKIRKISITTMNQELLQYFYNKKWINKFEIDLKDSSCYRVEGKRSIKNMK